ncbi:GNAT family N-acetyltransferase [Dankookia sp. GCM10030260]|uniref:GNAT family N-acetyltransferase n=1 Tax=Dankookia sp. GCM10030260 TaxID=3273390 RepID=UPI0036200D07
MLVRPLRPADRAALLEHAAALNLHEQPFSGDRNLAPDGAAASLDHILGRVAATGGAAWVAEAGGQVVGHLCLTLDTMPAYVAADRRAIAYVSDAYVRDAARGRGIFRALLAEAEAFAAARGATRIMIGLLAGNLLAERAYRAAGFQPYALELAKDLPPPA